MSASKCFGLVIPRNHCEQFNVTQIFGWCDDKEFKQSGSLVCDSRSADRQVRPTRSTWPRPCTQDPELRHRIRHRSERPLMFRNCVPREEPPNVIVDCFDGGLLISPLLPHNERDQMVAVSRFPKCENAPQPRVHFIVVRLCRYSFALNRAGSTLLSPAISPNCRLEVTQSTGRFVMGAKIGAIHLI